MEPEFTKNDKFRQSYAVLAKHLLIEKPHLSLYLIQKCVMTKWVFTESLKPFWTPLLKENLGNIIAGIGGTLSLATGGAALIVAFAVGGLIYAFDNKKTETMESKLEKVLDAHELKKIRSYLEAYETCFKGEKMAKVYFETVQKTNYILELSAKKNFVYKVITGGTFPDQDISTQIETVALYYRLSKLVLELTGLIFKTDLKSRITQFKAEHYKIRSLLEKALQKRVVVEKYYATIEGLHETIQLYNRDQLMDGNLFISAIFDELFRCPITGAVIEELYNEEMWFSKKQMTHKDFVKNIQTKTGPPSLYLGMRKDEYQESISAPASHKVRKIAFQENKGWFGYYENCEDKSGCHDQKYSDTKVKIQFDKIRLLYFQQMVYFNKGQIKTNLDLVALDRNYKRIFITRFFKKQLKVDKNMNYCVEFQNSQAIGEIRISGQNFKFKLKATTGQTKNFGPFTGFIATPDKTYRLGYGTRDFWKGQFSKGYTFHKRSSDDESQQLIFQDIKPLNTFSQTELSEFTCRISTKYYKEMFMVRDDREKEESVFGNHQSGGELIRIKLVERLGKGQYTGEIYVRAGKEISTYLADNYDLYWTKNVPKEGTNRFYMHINQKG